LIHEEKADGNRLKKVMLEDNEWELLDELCNILAPFEKATRDFSGSTYATLSQMFPIITNLTNSLEPLNDRHEEYEGPDDETISSDSEESLSNQQNEIDYKNIPNVLESVKKSIYLGLKHYWAMPNKFGIMAALLDPRYKNLDFISDDEIKRKIHSTLQAEYDQLRWEIQQQSTPPSPSTTISTISDTVNLTPNTRSLREHQARREQRTKEVLRTERVTSLALADEITTYFHMPIARENKNPLNWWKVKQEIFPILSIIAQKYLGIPATSVASERLFSDAGNHITAKRNSLDPGLLGKMLFLKRNMQTMDRVHVFPLDLNEEKCDFIEDECELDHLDV
jgi:hypothetical protein